MLPRCPVVTVMGHVDHGKTSLLDTIRNANVAEGEKGGITQHIGAYKVTTPRGEIAFVDTPGHEAFTSMRARGAQVTDIVILVVAAEEGPKPQTIEAINHARAAQVPIIVAINKVDKPEANPEKVRQELSNYGLLSEEWGGDTIFVEVSAKKNLNIDKLLEMVLLQAEMLDLKANPDKPAKGTIIEARLDKGRGPMATVLVQEGTLRVGDSFASKQHFGKVRALIDAHGRTMKEAGPSTPVEIIGFAAVPEAGDMFLVVDEKKARQTSDYWQAKLREGDLRKDARISLENFMSSVAEADAKVLRIVLKADVQGSFEALKQSLENLSTDEIKVQIIHSSVGAISQNDVMLAAASKAIIIGFNVKTEPKVNETAEQEKVDVRNYQIIYDVMDEVKRAMLGMLAPKFAEKSSGKAEVRQVFEISKLGTIAGCYVIEGRILSRSKGRVLRGGEAVYEGDISSLKRFKDDVREAASGQDCGIALGSYKDFQEGDIIESFIVEELERKL
jgi:translation initiation factor IF-2